MEFYKIWETASAVPPIYKPGIDIDFPTMENKICFINKPCQNTILLYYVALLFLTLSSSSLLPMYTISMGIWLPMECSSLAATSADLKPTLRPAGMTIP